MIDLRRDPALLPRLLREVSRWPKERPGAVILGASPNGLSFLRSIGRRHVPVLVLEGPKPLPALWSRYGTGLLLPDPLDEEARWMETILAIGGAAPTPPVLIPTSDALVLLVSRRREELGEKVHFVLPDADVLEKLPNKSEQYRLAAASGVPIPKTFYPSTEREAEEAGREVGFPCIVKPYYAHLWKRRKEGKLVEANDLSSLVEAFRGAREIGEPVMVQEKIPGGDDSLYGLLAYYDRESRPLCLFTKRKLRQYPPGFGDGSLQMTLRVPEVRDLGDRFFRAMRYRGLGSVEFKKDERSGAFKLIEVNPRSVSGQGMTTAAGMDIPYLAYLDIGRVERVEPTEAFREGIHFVNERWDVLSFLAYRRLGRLTFRQWLGGFFGKKLAFAFFSWRDPMPSFHLWGRVLANRFRRSEGRRAVRSPGHRGAGA